MRALRWRLKHEYSSLCSTYTMFAQVCLIFREMCSTKPITVRCLPYMIESQLSTWPIIVQSLLKLALWLGNSFPFDQSQYEVYLKSLYDWTIKSLNLTNHMSYMICMIGAFYLFSYECVLWLDHFSVPVNQSRATCTQARLMIGPCFLS